MLANRSLKLKNFLVFQFIILVTGAFTFSFLGWYESFSFIIGGGLMFVANVLMLWRFFFRKQLFSPVKELLFLYAGELMKLVAVAIGTIIIAVWLKPDFIIFLGGLLMLQVCMWLMPFFFEK
jgi:F0F1-type ATP synthase assembly protein I